MQKSSTPGMMRWQAPEVGTPEQRRPPNQQQLQQLRSQAQQDGYQEGFAAGQAAAAEATAQLHAQLQTVLDALHQPLAAIDDTVIERITELAIRIAQRLIRRELRTNPTEVIAVVREALSVMPLGLSEIRLHLHPEDARLVTEVLSGGDSPAAWSVVEDPVLTRGGCRISSSSSQVDATVETRLARVINTILGGERDEDHAGE